MKKLMCFEFVNKLSEEYLIKKIILLGGNENEIKRKKNWKIWENIKPSSEVL